ncbi:hypothetical protein JTB14_015785 [Gonioctena quinquepunctata]|nr:hypothetical protein JTB14_015785 [Gonioctena quinquepunctata]
MRRETQDKAKSSHVALTWLSGDRRAFAASSRGDGVVRISSTEENNNKMGTSYELVPLFAREDHFRGGSLILAKYIETEDEVTEITTSSSERHIRMTPHMNDCEVLLHEFSESHYDFNIQTTKQESTNFSGKIIPSPRYSLEENFIVLYGDFNIYILQIQ